MPVVTATEGQENEPQEPGSATGNSSQAAKQNGEIIVASDKKKSIKEEAEHWKVPEDPVKTTKKRKKDRDDDKKRKLASVEGSRPDDVEMVSLLPDALLKVESPSPEVTPVKSSPKKDKKRKSSEHTSAEKEAEKALLELSRSTSSDVVIKYVIRNSTVCHQVQCT